MFTEILWKSVISPFEKDYDGWEFCRGQCWPRKYFLPETNGFVPKNIGRAPTGKDPSSNPSIFQVLWLLVSGRVHLFSERFCYFCLICSPFFYLSHQRCSDVPWVLQTGCFMLANVGRSKWISGRKKKGMKEYNPIKSMGLVYLPSLP